MKLLLDIALGKSIYTVCFFMALVVAIARAYYFETVLAINIALVLVCVLGVFIAVTAVVTGNEAIESLVWPKTNAKLDVCTVFSGGMDDGHSLVVQYSLEVNGQTYFGNSYILGTMNYGRNAAEKIVSDLKSKGDSLLVSYDPADPSVNVLKPGMNVVHYVRALTGVGIIGFTVFELFGWTHFI